VIAAPWCDCRGHNHYMTTTRHICWDGRAPAPPVLSVPRDGVAVAPPVDTTWALDHAHSPSGLPCRVGRKIGPTSPSFLQGGLPPFTAGRMSRSGLQISKASASGLDPEAVHLSAHLSVGAVAAGDYCGTGAPSRGSPRRRGLLSSAHHPLRPPLGLAAVGVSG
jgi:hypothetical protein